MVAEKVDVISRAQVLEVAWKWSSDGKNGYSLEVAERDIAGTDIILYLKKEEKEFLDEARINSYLVRKFSDHLAYAVNWRSRQRWTRRASLIPALGYLDAREKGYFRRGLHPVLSPDWRGL